MFAEALGAEFAKVYRMIWVATRGYGFPALDPDKHAATN